jgi:hypothetical protein
MTEAERWLEEFAASQEQVQRPLIYWPSAFLVIIGAVGLLWSLPVPEAFQAISPALNWGTTFLMAAVVYYFVISTSLAIGMLPFIVGVMATETWIAQLPFAAHWTTAEITLVGLTGLWLARADGAGLPFIGRHLQLIMLAPLYLLADIYRRLRIPF